MIAAAAVVSAAVALAASRPRRWQRPPRPGLTGPRPPAASTSLHRIGHAGRDRRGAAGVWAAGTALYW